MTVAPWRRTHVCRGRAAPSHARHGQRRFRGWMSGWWAGRGACGAHGAALQDLSRFAAEGCRGLYCEHRSVGDGPKQRRFDRRQPERGFEQRQARRYAEHQRLGRPHFGCRLLVLGVVCDERFWASGGSRRQIDGHGGTGERSEDEEGSEPRRKPGLQLVASTRPRGHRHFGRLPRATRRRPIAAPGQQRKRMVPASEEVKPPQQNGRIPPGSGDALRMARPFDLRRCGTLERILAPRRSSSR
jgi:hypothetical protein